MITALVPFKPLSEAKSRLANILSPADRRTLALAMLDDVLTALSRSSSIDHVIVTASDHAAQALVMSRGLEFMPDTAGTLNGALQAAITTIDPASMLMVVHADLPLLEEDDIDEFITLMPSDGLVLAASNDDGTTAAMCAVPQRMQWSFGEHSLQRHIAAARARNIPVVSVREGPITFDIDRPVDLYRLLNNPGGRQTGRLLARMNIKPQNEIPSSSSSS
jgi:2-phospho-L-lactate guanylyltransferase